MNRLKSIFISAAISIWAYFTFIFIMSLLNNGLTFTALGLFLVGFLPLAFFMILLALKPVARTSKSLAILTTLTMLGVILIVVEVIQENTELNNLIVALASLVMWIFYVYWYSFLPKSKIEIKVGSQMPELNFKSGLDQYFNTSSLKGKKVLYMFYRGNWCPLCMAQIKEISAQYQELERRGVEVLLISPQKISKSVALAKKMEVNFHFVTDEDNKVARSLKINHDHSLPLGMEILGYESDSVLPTVIITNEQGEIIFLDQTDNYRLRPEPETFLKAIDA